MKKFLFLLNQWVFPLVMVSFIFLPKSGFSQNQVPDEVEYAALKALYDNTNGASWTENTNWLQGNTAADFATWYGVSVVDGDVAEISLSLNNLDGPVPAAIGDLIKLQTLNLSSNSLSGALPPEIGSLQSLIDFDLANNFLSGSIPAEVGNMASLVYLDLGKNSLSGAVPAAISGLGSLEYLSLKSNDLSGSIPAETGNLPKLRELNLSSNKFSGTIPASIGNLSQLEYLYLHYNRLEGEIPDSIGNLLLLKSFYAHSNKLTGLLPASIGNLTNLGYLYLYNNDLSGSIPSTIGNLNRLYYFHLGHNNFSGELPESIGNMTNLGFLFLSNNNFSGSIPASIGNLTKLGLLYLQNNDLSGSIPAEIGNMGSLGRLYLYGNQLSGTIPTSIGNMLKLDRLKLENNLLEGALPESVLTLDRLKELELAGNYLTEIPDLKQLSGLTNLSLTLNNNNLTFKELEKLFNSDGSTSFGQLIYKPQNISAAPDPSTVNADSVQEVFFADGADLTIHTPKDGEQTGYQWKKWDGSSWQQITGATDSIFQKSSASLSDEGYFIAEKNNSLTGSSFYIYSLVFNARLRNESDSIAPPAPANLVVSDLGETQVSVQWAAVEDTSSMVIRYNAYLNGLRINPELIDSTSYTIGNLQSGTGYSFYVTAEDSEGDESSPSNQVVLNPGNYMKLEVPLTLGSDDAEEYQSGSVNVVSESMELTYDSLNSGAGNQIVGLRFAGLDIPKTAFVEQAYIQFRAFSSSNDTTTLTIRAEETDSAATFTDRNYNLSNRMLTAEKASWQPSAWKSPGVAGHAERTPDLSFILKKQLKEEGWKMGNPIAFVLTGSGKRVASTVESGGAASLVVWYSAEAPLAPAALAAEERKEYISLSWEDKAFNEEGFVVERKTATGTFSGIDSLAANTSEYADLTPLADSVYSYRVVAYNSQGSSPASNMVTAQLLPSVPVAPAALLAEGTGPAQIKLQWQDKSDNETGFTIEYQAEDGTGWHTLHDVGKDVSSFIDTNNLSIGKRKVYRVKAYNKEGASEASNQADAFTQHKVVAAKRINAGGEVVVASGEQEWQPDAFYAGGTASTSIAASLASSRREGDFSYSIPLEAQGKYSVRLYFQEEEASAVGERTFNVLVNGSLVLEGLDVYSEAGKGKLLTKDVGNIQLSGTEARIDFQPVSGEALVNGIELVYQDNPLVKRIFVKGDAAGLNDGSSWDNAFRQLSDALTLAGNANAEAEKVEVWVAAGTYLPDSADRTKSFELVDHVALYGGFAGTETALEERDWIKNKSVLSGDIGTQEDRSDNSFHVVKGLNQATTIFDGFTVMKGNADGTGLNSKGGGLFLGDSSAAASGFPTIRNIHFLENRATEAGGGLFAEGKPGQQVFNVSNCRFEGNYASKGGGVYASSGEPAFFVKLLNSSFSGNVAEDGGALYVSALREQGALKVVNSTFAANQSNVSNSGGTGGAIYASNVAAEIYNSILWINYNYLAQDTINFNHFYFSEPAAAVVKNNIIQHGYGSEEDLNLGEDPEFVLEPHPGKDLSWINDSSDTLDWNVYGFLEPDTGSPAIDAAEAEYYAESINQDAEGRNRFFKSSGSEDSMLDIGAYEHQQKEDTIPELQPHFLVDTEVFDSSFSYVLSYSGFEDTLQAGTNERFNFSGAEVQGDSLIVLLTLLKNGEQGEQLFLIVDSYAGKIVEPVYLNAELTKPLASIYYQVESFNRLVLQQNNQVVENPGFNLNLENGLFYRLKGGESKNLLELQVEEDPEAFAFTILNDAEVAVFQTTDFRENWSGFNQLSGTRVKPGRYSFLLEIDGSTYKGQFLVSN